MVDIAFDNEITETIKGMVGKTFEAYSCDPFIFTPNVFGIVGFRIDGKCYKMTSDLETVQRFFSADDVAVMRISACDRSEIVSKMDDGQMIDNPVEDTIRAIDIVNDRETVTHDEEQKTLYSTKGVIFHLASGNEISFELGTWFSEMITIRRGYDLINSFTPIEDFLEDWEDSDGYNPGCVREVKTIA